MSKAIFLFISTVHVVHQPVDHVYLRYDVRAHLLEMSGNSSSESSDSDSDEELIEELCDEERYLALKTGIVMKEQDKGIKYPESTVCGLYVKGTIVGPSDILVHTNL